MPGEPGASATGVAIAHTSTIPTTAIFSGRAVVSKRILLLSGTSEGPPLARALHATVELDQEIPPEHYKAVAGVIGYVMRLSGKVPRN